MAAHLTRSDCEGVFLSAVYPMQWMGPMRICCGMAIKRMGLLHVSVMKMKALTMQ
jgi:hypothetical protein